MNPLVSRLLPVSAVIAALVGGCAGVLASATAPPVEGGSALVRVEPGPRLSLAGDGGPAPRFDVVDLRPGQSVARTFVVTRQGPAAPGVLVLSAADVVEVERACEEPERAVDPQCSAGSSGELDDQLVVRVGSARPTPSGRCDVPRSAPARPRTLRALVTEPVVVGALLGGTAAERLCVTVALALPDRTDNNAVQGEQVTFALRFTATTGGPT